VVICLVGSTELHATGSWNTNLTSKADRLNNISTLFILYFNTLSLLSCGALGIGSGNTLGGVVVDSHLLDDGHVVGDDCSIITLPHRNLGGANLVNKLTLLPGLQLAVLIPCPHLLSSSIQHPLGVALLPGHISTDWHLVVFVQGLESILDTLLGGEAKSFNTVIIEVTSELIRAALGVANHLTILVGDGHTCCSNLFGAHPICSVGTDGGYADVVLDLAVPGDVNTKIIVTISMVVAATFVRVSGHNERKKEE